MKNSGTILVFLGQKILDISYILYVLVLIVEIILDVYKNIFHTITMNQESTENCTHDSKSFQHDTTQRRSEGAGGSKTRHLPP